MKTKTVHPEATQKHQVGLIRGEFSPEEALEILESLIDQKVRFNEVRKFQRWTNDHNCDTTVFDSRIKELKIEKENLLEFMKGLQGSGRTISIDGSINITVNDAVEK